MLPSPPREAVHTFFLPHSQHVPCPPGLVLSAASLASVTIVRGHWDHFLSSTAAPQFSHTASAGRARVSPSGISGVFSGFVAYLVVITHANVVFLMIWRQESRKACVSLQSLYLTEDIRTCSNNAKDYKLLMLFLLVDRTKLSQVHLPWLLL